MNEIKTGYLANLSNYPNKEEYVFVMRGRGNDELAPSKQLLKDYKELEEKFGREIAWERSNYEKRFKEEILSNSKAVGLLEKFAEEVYLGSEIRLICYEKDYPCHRFILKDLIDERVKEREGEE